MALLELPSDTLPILVATVAQLEVLQTDLLSAYACAIDAEWEPGVKPARATLVQLAFRSEQSADKVYLLDLLALPQGESKIFLQQLFRRKSTLKVGYGLPTDLKAIGLALGGEGGSAVAVVEPYIDIRDLHRALQRQHRILPKVTGSGLAGLVDGMLQLSLDKRLQCSAWGCRPLSPEQITYAALDSLCLLTLLDRFVELCPVEPATARTEQDAQTPASSIGPTIQQEAPVGLVTSHEKTHATGHGSSDNVAQSTEQPLRFNEPEMRTEAPSTSGSCAAAEASMGSFQAAAAAWGCRLELTGSSASASVKRRGGIHSGKHHAPHALEDDLIGFPEHVPWRDASSNQVGEARFIADVMAEGLARQLRLCGFDVSSAPNLPKEQRPKVYRILVESAEAEQRVILTCDRLLIRRRLSEQAYWVQASDKKKQLTEVLAAFQLAVKPGAMMSRCVKCNGDFVPRPMQAAELPSESLRTLPAYVVQQEMELWVCSNCSQVYWKGQQFENCKSHLTDRLKALTLT